MRALLVAGSLAAFTLLGAGLAQAADPILPGWSGSSIPITGDTTFGSSGLELESGANGSALGSETLGSSTTPARAEVANRIFAALLNLPA